jgi:hypothetical protein
MASKIVLGIWDVGDGKWIQRAELYLFSSDISDPNKHVKAICKVWFNAGSMLRGGNYVSDCRIADDKLWLLETPWVGEWLNAINEGEVIEDLLRQAAEWTEDG